MRVLTPERLIAREVEQMANNFRLTPFIACLTVGNEESYYKCSKLKPLKDLLKQYPEASYRGIAKYTTRGQDAYSFLEFSQED